MNILLAIDLSPASDAAIAEVANATLPPGTVVEVLSVIEPAPPWTLSEVVEEMSRRAEEHVVQVAELLRARGLSAVSKVLSGDPKEVIVDRASEFGAELVVLGSHGHARITEFLVGGVARTIVRFAPCSVRIVRGDLAAGESSNAGELSKKDRPGERILLPTDGSEGSMQAARAVAARPWSKGTEVRILSVVELDLTTFQALLEPPFFDSETMTALRADAMKRAQDAIQSASEVIRAAGLETSESISVLVESPQQIIVEEAKEWGASLIVVGSHGRRGVNRFMLGSVSEGVATLAGCSVEVVRKR